MSKPRHLSLVKPRGAMVLRDHALEREFLSIALVDPARALDTLERIRPEDIDNAIHDRLYRAMRQIAERGGLVEPAALRSQLIANGQWEAIGGAQALTELLDRVGTCSNAAHYATELRRISLQRQLHASWESGAADVVDGVDRSDRLARIRALEDELEGIEEPTQALDDFAAWTSSRYEGDPPPVDWLVPDMVSRGEAHLLAAPGDSGKGFITLELGLQLASGLYRTGRRAPLGKAILPMAEPCSVVLLYAEDSEAAVHRRLHALDPDGSLRARAGRRFVALAMPSAGGAMSVLERTQGGEFITTARWRQKLDQLAAIPDLGLVVLDPLSCFLALDIDSDSAVAQAAMGEMARVATVLNAAVLVAHHMRKAQEPLGNPRILPELPTHESVRASIRGVAALLNGVRMAYGIVPLPGRFAKAVLAKLREPGEFDVGRVYWGAVVKANGKTDRRPRLYVRAEYGLLEDRTHDIAAMGRLDDALKALVTPGGKP